VFVAVGLGGLKIRGGERCVNCHNR
jgi:hypothetical protein